MAMKYAEKHNVKHPGKRVSLVGASVKGLRELRVWLVVEAGDVGGLDGRQQSRVGTLLSK